MELQDLFSLDQIGYHILRKVPLQERYDVTYAVGSALETWEACMKDVIDEILECKEEDCEMALAPLLHTKVLRWTGSHLVSYDVVERPIWKDTPHIWDIQSNRNEDVERVKVRLTKLPIWWNAFKNDLVGAYRYVMKLVYSTDKEQTVVTIHIATQHLPDKHATEVPMILWVKYVSYANYLSRAYIRGSRKYTFKYLPGAKTIVWGSDEPLMLPPYRQSLLDVEETVEYKYYIYENGDADVTTAYGYGIDVEKDPYHPSSPGVVVERETIEQLLLFA